MQLVNIVITFCVYYPFFRMWDKQKRLEEEGDETANSQEEKVV